MHPGPVNRGVELAPEVIDSPQSLITAQVESGLVVRMAVLYELLAGQPTARGPSAARRRREPADDRAAGMNVAADGPSGAATRLSWRRGARPPTLVIRGARVLDPRAGLDAVRDVVVRDGEIAELAEPGGAPRSTGPRSSRPRGCSLLPAFFDPHVHLRIPGQEDEEDLETGTRAAAAGGYCAVVAMANTEPPIDSAAGAGLACASAPSERPRCRSGSSPPSPGGWAARSSPRWPSCARPGRSASPTTGSRSRAPRVLRRALQYQRLAAA